MQIAIGTHAFVKVNQFNHLGLLIVDEEQHFGVGQKERLKEIRGDIHVLTLSATPFHARSKWRCQVFAKCRLLQRRLLTGWRCVPVDHGMGLCCARRCSRKCSVAGRYSLFVRIDDMQRVYDRLTKLAPEARILSACAWPQMS